MPAPSPAATHHQPTARDAALQWLIAITERAQSLDQTSAQPRLAKPEDRALAMSITLSVLRHLTAIDAWIDQHCELPLKGSVARQVLRIGVAQLVLMKMPAYAVVDTSVELVARVSKGRFKGMVNAVLRKAVTATLPPSPMPVPDWMLEGWRRSIGPEAEQLLALTPAEPPLDITLKPGKAMSGATQVTPHTHRLHAWESVEQLPGYAEGDWWVQDASSALAAPLLGDIAGKQVLDLCAAPGGKTAQLCAMGVQVTAIDRSAQRLKRLEANMARLGFAPKVITADLTGWEPESLADAALLDAPCTATGTFRRHPDVFFNKTPADLEAMRTLQRRLLDRAHAWVKPGGYLIYCTCSLQPEEGEEQITAFLAESPHWNRKPVTLSELPSGLHSAITPTGDLRLTPLMLGQQGGMDGFFIARLQKA